MGKNQVQRHPAGLSNVSKSQRGGVAWAWVTGRAAGTARSLASCPRWDGSPWRVGNGAVRFPPQCHWQLEDTAFTAGIPLQHEGNKQHFLNSVSAEPCRAQQNEGESADVASCPTEGPLGQGTKRSLRPTAPEAESSLHLQEWAWVQILPQWALGQTAAPGGPLPAASWSALRQASSEVWMRDSQPSETENKGSKPLVWSNFSCSNR